MSYKLKVMLSYVLISLLVGIFSYVYLSFVPGVFNLSMVGAFSIPLLAGILEVAIKQKENKPNHIQRGLFRLAIATMTVQVVLKGIYQIALTNFRGEFIYVSAWMLLIVASLFIKE